MDSDSIATYVTIGVFIVAAVYSFVSTRNTQRTKRALEEQLRVETSRREEAERAKETVVKNLDVKVLQQEEEQRDEKDFAANAAAGIRLDSAVFRGLALLKDGEWRLQPGMNVLLGRNGYGKSLLLRMVAIALSRNSPKGFGIRTGGEFEVRITRGGKPEQIACSDSGFMKTIGPVPLLAIPDSRFVTRNDTRLRQTGDPFVIRARHGARQFLTQTPYNGVVEQMLHTLCLDFWQARNFDGPIFKVITEAFNALTDKSFKFASADRSGEGESEFNLKVFTEGNREPVLVQSASQGTLSVLAVFGLIYRFLAKLPGDKPPTERRAIVIIDEVDAHLHPAWQRRIGGLLRTAFPNVQLIVSAHSPLLVAGCGPGEVSVMKKAGDQFYIETYADRDFVGAKADDIYDAVFEITDGEDDVFMAHSKLVGKDDTTNDARIAQLQELHAAAMLSEDQAVELRELERRRSLIRKAGVVENARFEEENELADLRTERSELRIKVRDLERELASVHTSASDLAGKIASASAQEIAATLRKLEGKFAKVEAAQSERAQAPLASKDA